jgi:putative ABC transport system ATP-binding protein
MTATKPYAAPEPPALAVTEAPTVVLITDVAKAYPADGEAVHALQGVSLRVNRGEFVAVMGASGSGKSTLLHLLAGLDRPTSGSIQIEGGDLSGMSDGERTVFRRRRLGLVFQSYNLLPTLSAIENVGLPALLDGRNHRAADEKARTILRQVDLAHRAVHRPQAMSGGEQQRVAIARALINDPALLLADEPTGNLDSEHGAAIWRLLRSLARQHERTILAVTHEADGAAFADRIVVLKDGRVVGEITPHGEHDAAYVATRYRELLG